MACFTYRVYNELNLPGSITYQECGGGSVTTSVPGLSNIEVCIEDNIYSTDGNGISVQNLGIDCGGGIDPCDAEAVSIAYGKTDVTRYGLSDGTATIILYSTLGTFTIRWLDNNSNSLTRTGLSGGVYPFTWTYTCPSGGVRTDTIAVTIIEPAQLTATATITNVTVNGGNDGTITISASGGASGIRSFLWNDNVTTRNRTGLVAGTYSVVITDIVSNEQITINNLVVTEPNAQPQPPAVGSVFEIPFLNSIHFVENNTTGVQGLDNVAFCEQEFKGFGDVSYFQKIEKGDSKIIQFNSNFETHIFELRDIYTDAVVKLFYPTLVEQNIGIVEEHAITIRNHTTLGKSRVYFSAGQPPVSLALNNTFEIINSDTYNGSYLIVGIETDPLLGYDYILINRQYTSLTPSSFATGRFYNDLTDFNVYEVSVDFIDVADGLYYMRGVAISSNQRVLLSEPIDLKIKHEGTTLITYRNEDNAFDITWTTGYIGSIRVESLFGHKRTIGGDQSVTRDSSYSLVKVSAKAQRILIFETFMLPMYLHEKLGLIFRLDTITINNITVQAEEGYAEPTFVDRFLLANSSIRVEQVGWLNRYNTNDLGTVAEEGFIIGNEGFIKR